jgi:RNA polymerase sigma-70 factor (ECF subfamily)
MDDDLGTIQRVLAGEAEAYRFLVERYQRPVFAVIQAVLCGPDGAEDIAQDVFLAAYQNLGSFAASRAKFPTWLFAIARNRCFTERRRRARPLPLDAVADPPSTAGADSAARQREVREQLDRALDSLPEKMRSAFVLAELADLPYDEIARLEATNTGTIKSRIFRAREHLRGRLARYMGEPS